MLVSCLQAHSLADEMANAYLNPGKKFRIWTYLKTMYLCVNPVSLVPLAIAMFEEFKKKYPGDLEKVFNHTLMVQVKHKGMRVDDILRCMEGEKFFRFARENIPLHCSGEEHKDSLLQGLEAAWKLKLRTASSQDNEEQE